MFERLQKKWKVSGLRLALILCTFAVGGSLTGYAGRRLMNLFPIEQNWVWILVYVLVVTIIWPLSVLLVSIFFGQFRFFSSYLKKMGRRMRLIGIDEELDVQSSVTNDHIKLAKNRGTGNSRKSSKQNEPARLAIFASGVGSNAQKIIEHFRYSYLAKVVVIVCNKPGAGVLQIAEKEHIPVILLDKEKFFRGNGYVDELSQYNVDLIILSGFLWKIPLSVLKAWPGRIINIHPALLPKYGGKGMYGQFVHEAVLANREKESGISIHYVDEIYDHGGIIFQISCPVLESDTPQSLAQRIHKLEHAYYPETIEKIIGTLVSKD